MLKKENSFLYDGESTSQQQVYRDLNKSFNKFFKEGRGFPKFKSKNNTKQSFRIQKNGNNIRITNRRIRLAKLGYVRYHTSSEYKKLLKNSKINNVTVKRENGKYSFLPKDCVKIFNSPFFKIRRIIHPFIKFFLKYVLIECFLWKYSKL